MKTAIDDLKSALRSVAELVGGESNAAHNALLQLERCLDEPKSECTNEAIENRFNSVLNCLLDLETKIKKNANAPTCGSLLGMPTLSLREIERRRRKLERAFKTYKAEMSKRS